MLLNKVSGLEEFEKDELYRQFLEEDFNIKAITSSAVQCAAVSEQLAKLSAGIALLDKALHHQVSNHYEDLLSQATEIETLEGVLLAVHQKISSLLTSADKLRSKVAEPYESISSLTRKLKRLHVVCDYVRRVIRILRLSKRLRMHMNKTPPEIGKAASCLNEIDSCLEEVNMTGIEVIESELEYIKNTKTVLEIKAACS